MHSHTNTQQRVIPTQKSAPRRPSSKLNNTMIEFMVFNTSTALFVLHALTQNQRAIPYPHKGLCQGVQEASPRWRRRGRRLVVRRVGRLATPHRGRDCSMAACFPFCRWGPHSSRTHVGDAERPVHHPWVPQGLKTRSSLRFSRLEKTLL